MYYLYGQCTAKPRLTLTMLATTPSLSRTPSTWTQLSSTSAWTATSRTASLVPSVWPSTTPPLGSARTSHVNVSIPWLFSLMRGEVKFSSTEIWKPGPPEWGVYTLVIAFFVTTGWEKDGVCDCPMVVQSGAHNDFWVLYIWSLKDS